MKTSSKIAPVPFKKMWQNGVDLIDLRILHALFNGDASRTTLQRHLEKLGLKFTRTQLTAKLNELIKKGIIVRIDSIVVDPTKIFDYVFFAFIKIHLPSIVAGYPRGTIDWRSAFEKIKEIDKEKGIIRMLFTLEGIGDYDMALLIYVNRLEDYYDLMSKLVKEGIIEKADGKRIHEPAGVIFDPVSLPPVNEYEKALSFYATQLQRMLSEGKQSTVTGQQ